MTILRLAALYTEADELVEERLLRDAGDTRHAAWQAIEASRSVRHWSSWRPGADETEDDCEDSERIVLFDDVSPFLFAIDSPVDLHALLWRVPELLGVAAPAGDGCAAEVAADAFGGHDLGCGIVGGCAVGGSRDWRDGRRFAWRVMTRCAERLGGDALRTSAAVAAVSVRREGAWKAARRDVKALLREGGNRNSLPLWAAYAAGEWASGRVREARGVLDAALVMHTAHAADGADGTDALLLYRAYSELELGLAGSGAATPAVHSQRAIHLLTSAVDRRPFEPFADRPVPPVRLLRCRRLYADLLTEVAERHAADAPDDLALVRLAGGDGPPLHAAVCFALFEYVTAGPDAAGAVFQRALAKLPAPPPGVAVHDDDYPYAERSAVERYNTRLHVLLMEAHVRMLRHHTDTHAAPLATLRAPLERALKRLPTNQMLTMLYVDLETRSHISGRLRRHFSAATARCESATVWLLAILSELRRTRLLADHKAAQGTGGEGEKVTSYN